MFKISLAAARVNRGMTQEEAARELKISKKTLVNWEKGVTYPNAAKIDDICRVYSVGIDNLKFLPSNNA